MMVRTTKWFAAVAFSALLAAPAPVSAQEQKSFNPAPPRYTVIDLGVLPGGGFSQATWINSHGLITGISTTPDGTQHAVIWRDGTITDIAKSLPAGINSGAFSVNEIGQVAVQAETTTQDPNNENFCAYFTGRSCRAFLWRNGVLNLLPIPGGNNSTVGIINNRGQLVGVSETNGIYDSRCPSEPAYNGIGPLVLDFQAVIWGPRLDQIAVLPPLPGDPVGIALGINDEGQAVGGSGSCSNTILPGPTSTPHAVLWENGKATNMGNLGGTVNTQSFGVSTFAFAINNKGEAVGAAALPGNATSHAFLWSKKLRRMLDLGTVPGDTYSVGLDINNEGAVVGASLDSDGNPGALLFVNGAMNDLNTLVPPDSPIYMLVGDTINDFGQVVGFGVDNFGDVHGFLATPCSMDQSYIAWCRVDSDIAGADIVERPRKVLSESTREQMKQHLRFRLPGTPFAQPQ
jgi:probable HAF family extracellular repeat protein